MLIATTGGIAGRRIVTTLGFVFGLSVRRRGLGSNIMAGLENFGHGSAMEEFRADLTATRSEALTKMEMQAEALEANAIVGVRFTTAEVGHDMSEIVAYGTAVVIASDP
jgi:uncharacterized protein YbjQ (UPF0145 family)